MTEHGVAVPDVITGTGYCLSHGDRPVYGAVHGRRAAASAPVGTRPRQANPGASGACARWPSRLRPRPATGPIVGTGARVAWTRPRPTPDAADRLLPNRRCYEAQGLLEQPRGAVRPATTKAWGPPRGGSPSSCSGRGRRRKVAESIETGHRSCPTACGSQCPVDRFRALFIPRQHERSRRRHLVRRALRRGSCQQRAREGGTAEGVGRLREGRLPS